MAHVSVGKLLPNLKVTLGNTESEVEMVEEKDESSEKQVKISGDSSNVEMVRFWMESLQNPKVYKNKSGGFTTGLDLTSEENTQLLGKRAERFGLEKEEISLLPSINSLYESMGIDISNKNSAKMKNIRLDALHMRGVNEMNTNEIFQYFKDYGPASVEWINDFSCNVVWLDETSCARALLGMSKPLPSSKTNEEETHSSDDSSPTHSKPVNSEELPTEEPGEIKEDTAMQVEEDSTTKTSPSESLDIPIPPGCWRMGTPYPKAKCILLRFATKDDKKVPGAEKRSDFYRKYGNPNYGGLKGLISGSRKRKMQAASNRKAIGLSSSKGISPLISDDDPVERPSKPKAPRMRMYADEEEIKAKKLRTRDSYKSHNKPASVHSRLGTKYTRDDLCYLGSSTQRDTTYRKNWSSSDDLRKKLSRNLSTTKHRSPLCADSDDSLSSND